MPDDLGSRHPNTVHLLRLFASDHLPPHLQQVSAPVGGLAFDMACMLPDGPELSFALRQLLLAKDALVRARVLQAQDTKDAS